MTPATALARQAAPRSTKPNRAKAPLQLVSARALPAPRAPFVALIVGLLSAGLIGLLLLNTVIAENSFRIHALQQRTAALDLRQQALQRDIDSREAPNTLAARAHRLGMVPAGSPAFIRVPDGAVFGVPAPATAPRVFRFASPHPTVKPSPTPSASAGTPKPSGSPAPAPAPTPSSR